MSATESNLDIKLTDSRQPGTLHSRRFDPARSAADREWIPMDVASILITPRPSDLEISVSAGPQGDLVADWLALAELADAGKRRRSMKLATSWPGGARRANILAG